MFARYETNKTRLMEHRIRSVAMLAGAILLANIVVIAVVMTGLSGMAHAAVHPVNTTQLATMLAAPDISPIMPDTMRFEVFGLMGLAFATMLAASTAMWRRLARDLERANVRH